MNVLLMRHATAEDPNPRVASASRDAARALTEIGKREAQHAARDLHRLLRRLDVVASSPYLRAKQTAEILAAEFDCAAPLEVPALAVASASAKGVLAWLHKQSNGATVALVGHEPSLSALISWFLIGRDEGLVEMRKASACLIVFAGRAEPGEGRLSWLLPPLSAEE